MKDIFNTPFELSLRILIILFADQSRLTVDRLTALDYISTYGKDFRVSEYNLHGENNYRFSEYASRREIVSQSIKKLVVKGYIKPYCNKSGFRYGISKNGISFCESLNDDYAECFIAIVKKAIEVFSNYSDRKLASCINEYAIAMFGGK
jgi:hypothetical protein